MTQTFRLTKSQAAAGIGYLLCVFGFISWLALEVSL